MFDIPLQNSLDTNTIAVLVLAFLGGLGLIYWGFRTYRIGRLIRDTATEKVRSVAVGRTELEGTAIPDEYVFDRPFTEGKCLYASYTIQEYKKDHSDDNNNKEWKTVLSNTVAAPFYLDDGTGQILVDADPSATFEISDEYTTEIRVNNSPPEKVRKFLSGTGGGATDAVVDTVSNIMGSMGGFGGGQGGGGGPISGDEQSTGTAPATGGTDGDGQQMAEATATDGDDGHAQPGPAIAHDEKAVAALEEMDEAEMEAIQRDERDPPPELEPYTGDDGEMAELLDTPGNVSQFFESGIEAALDTQGADDDADEPTVTHIPRSDLNTSGSVLDTYADDADDTDGADESDDSLLGTVKSTASTVSEFAGGGGVSNTHRKRRYKQAVLPVEEETYVYGGAKQRDVSIDATNEERVTIGEDEDTGEFIVSDYGESEIASAYTKRAIIFIVVGLVVSAGALGILVNGMGL